MQRLKLFVQCFIGITGLFVGSFVSAATLYVAPSGADTNPGTETSPFKTIQKAANVVNPGDTVIVEDGVYKGVIDGGSIVNFTRGGTSSTNKILFKSRNKFGAKIDGGVGTSIEPVYGFRFSANYIRVEGFDLYGIANGFNTNKGCSAILIYSPDGGGVGVEIADNHIHHIGRVKTETVNGLSGIFVQQNNVLIEGNLLHDIGRYAPGENGTVYSPGYVGYQNHDHGIYHHTGNDVTIRNNIFYHFKRGFAIQEYPDARARVKIINNHFIFPNPYSRCFVTFYATSATDSTIANNIFYDPGSPHAVELTSGKSYAGTIIANNITYDGKVSNILPTGTVFSNNQDNTDPKMIKISSEPYDFHLQSTSSGIDRGMSISESARDYDGILRPQGAGYDIGAYEYVSASGSMDADGDGLVDSWEVAYFGSIADSRARPDQDPDGDGFTNLDEYKAGTSPINSSSRLNFVNESFIGLNFQIHWQSLSNITYEVQTSTDMTNWTAVGVVTAVSTNTSWIDGGVTGVGKKFYRVRVP